MSFSDRHIGPRASDLESMLQVVGAASLEDLVARALPSSIAMTQPLDLAEPQSEADHLAHLRALAAMNFPGRSMIGMGYSGTLTPAVIRRNVLENPSWYTAYTPYQPEISQGRLEALLNFQTMVADLTGLPTAGSSLLDEATAAAEAMALAKRQVRKGSVFLVDPRVLPQTLAVLRTRAEPLGVEVVVGQDDLVASLQSHEAFGVLIQTPGLDGEVRTTEQLRAIAQKAHENGALVISASDLLALTLITPPGQWGADVAIGSTQRFGVPLFYGGPHAGYISVAEGLERSLPGRLVGVSVDAEGIPAYRLALQTREQHIRREKATSNICTAQVLLAVVASMYAVYHGPVGLTAIAEQIHDRTRALAAALSEAGHQLTSEQFFDTVTVQVSDADATIAAARQVGIHLRRVDGQRVGISIGEDATQADLDALATVFGADLGAGRLGGLPGERRDQDFLTHEVFNTYRSETQLMRYLHTLASRDFALDQGMIPLGSCTMKLNSVAELEPISYPGFADLHPFVPAEDAAGYAVLIDELERWLVAITGYDRVSLQPNAGSQGEFAGLIAIQGYHRSRGDEQRTVCLIPSSAHGTNAASAAMAGMKVVVVKATQDGSVDMDDLRAKIAKHADELSAIMVTYPSTHGVFEDTITELCELVHAAGGQVYVDGANMNALVGLAQPGKFGADVSHLNLHKTFAIPHGGGGPGVGPVAVGEHLAPFLPGHPVVPAAGPATSPGAVSAAPWGSAGVLPISHGYIAMMGAQGLTQATSQALLNANYIAARLRDHFPVLYSGNDGLVAHECILDLREITKRTKVSVDDVAKRLIDYGFHAPTMSFPVAGTLMVEPTESEDLGELDRFCDAMISIAGEIEQVAQGVWPEQDNPLANAPHTQFAVTAETWQHPYSRGQAAYPMGRHRGPVAGHGHDKYWPPVARIDNVHGDRNLVCSCPPPEYFEE